MLEFLNTANIQFTVIEILSLIGLAQCVYVLVYMSSRVGHKKQAFIPIFFFIILGAAFFLDLAERYWGPYFSYYGDISWFLWSSLPPMSVLLVVQIANMNILPKWPYFLILLFLPLAYSASYIFINESQGCLEGECFALFELLTISSIIVGSLSLLTIWMKRGILSNIRSQKRGKERLWLTISLIILNIILLIIITLEAYGHFYFSEMASIRTVLGFAFVYLASTSLFRIYPLALTFKKKVAVSLSEKDKKIAKKIENLLDLEKIYQEPSYGRSNLAAELSITESNLSKIVNLHFDKTVPQLLNTYRVKDARHLIIETDEDFSIISKESGFNSLSTFNRYFKELEGVSPSEYRRLNKKA